MMHSLQKKTNRARVVVPGLVLISAVLAGCGQSSAGMPQAAVPVTPPALVVSSDTDLTTAASVSDRAGAQIGAMFSRDALTPDVYDTLAQFGLMGSGMAPPTLGTGTNVAALNPLSLGRGLLSRLQPQGGLSAQGLAGAGLVGEREQLLPTGTIHLNAQGMPTSSEPQPTDGLVIINDRTGLTLKNNWKVDGAATLFLTLPTTQDGLGTYVTPRIEVPTSASVQVSRTGSGEVVAAAKFSMTPGDCLAVSGPEAFSGQLWAGTAAAPELKASVDYRWNAQGVSFTAGASLNTTQGKLLAETALKMPGVTANRCDARSLSFSPSNVEASAHLSVPHDDLTASLKLQNVSNLMFKADALTVPHPFSAVQGTLSATAAHNSQPFFSAYGELADGPDVDLIPGDAVTVKYVSGQQIVTTNLQAFLVSATSSLK